MTSIPTSGSRAVVDLPRPREAAPAGKEGRTTARGTADSAEGAANEHAHGATRRRSRRPAGGAHARGRREGSLHHAHDDPGRGALGRGPRADRVERGHDPRAGRHRLSRGARRAATCCETQVRRSTASACASREGLARQLVQATAPRTFTQVARNPANSVEIGGTSTVFAPAYGSPFVRDLEGGRRYGTIEDFRNFVKLAYASPYLHHSGGTVCEPVDLPVNKRHLDMVYAHLRYSDKPFMGSVTHPQRAEDTVEMARIVFGADFMEENTVILSLCNANSPLVWDATMLGAAKAYAEANQAVLMTPFILAGAMSPVTVGGSGHADLRRGARRHGLRPARPARRAGRARLVRVVALDAVGSADLRDAGAGARALRHGGARPAARRPLPLGRRLHRVEDPGRAGGVRVGEHDATDLPRRRQLRPPRGGLARGRPDDGIREVRPRQRPVRDVARVRQGRRHDRERAGARRAADERAGAALPRPRAHARELRDGLLPLTRLRQLELRAVGGRGRDRGSAARGADLEEDARGVRAAADRRRRRRGAREWIERKKASFPDSDY